MPIHLINLDRSPDRLAAFEAGNPHLIDVVRVAAVDGRAVDRNRLHASGLAPRKLSYSDGAVGCALSHLALWEKAIADRQSVTVCEDDAIFNRNFHRSSREMLKLLPKGWDITLWGWNFDAFVLLDFLPGISPCFAQFDEQQMRTNLKSFADLRITASALRLRRAFGATCYTISPAGAGKLRSFCFPLRDGTVHWPDTETNHAIIGIDVLMSTAYPEMSAYASFPPLVVTPNDHAVSTVQVG
jgi:GR25 family glycosyltransferase involved in LPS biosynthesis